MSAKALPIILYLKIIHRTLQSLTIFEYTVYHNFSGCNAPNYRSQNTIISTLFGYWKITVTKASHSGMALGNDKFKDELENLKDRRLHNFPPGRKFGW